MYSLKLKAPTETYGCLYIFFWTNYVCTILYVCTKYFTVDQSIGLTTLLDWLKKVSSLKLRHQLKLMAFYFSFGLTQQ